MIQEGLEEERRVRLPYGVGITEADAAVHVDAALAGGNNGGDKGVGVGCQRDDVGTRCLWRFRALGTIRRCAESKRSCA